jgi:sugar O-acyltransferase (sialic acid O-acetyltransferase NeuD family)
MKTAYIFGTSGHASVIASIIKSRYDSIFYIDLKPTEGNIINHPEFVKDIEKYKNDDIFIGIGSNKIRKKIFLELKQVGATIATCIADNTFVSNDAVLGEGVLVCPGSIIGAKAILGDNCIVNTLSSVDHDCILGAHSQVTAGVTFGGNTRTGENCFFGVKSATIPNITLGNNVIVMAGSVLFKDVQSNVMVGGTPARIMKELTEL